jgi:hypothetical protein
VDRFVSGNQQDVLIVLIRQGQRAQEDAKGIGRETLYTKEPEEPLQRLTRNPGQYYVEPLINILDRTLDQYYENLIK